MSAQPGDTPTEPDPFEGWKFYLLPPVYVDADGRVWIGDGPPDDPFRPATEAEVRDKFGPRADEPS